MKIKKLKSLLKLLNNIISFLVLHISISTVGVKMKQPYFDIIYFNWCTWLCITIFYRLLIH